MYTGKRIISYVSFLIIISLYSCSTTDDTSDNGIDLRRNSDFVPTILSVAHRGYRPSGVPENSAKAYHYAARYGFQFGETDIQWTKDDIPVCCHLKYFFDNCTGDSIFTERYTLARLKQFNYYGYSISTLEEVMDTCKANGMGLYLDRFDYFEGIRKERIYDLIDRFGKENVTYLFDTFNEKGIRQVLEYDPNATIALVYFSRLHPKLFNFAHSISTSTNKIILDIDVSQNPLDSVIHYLPQLKDNEKFGIWTINSKKDFKSYMPYVESITSDKISEIMLYK